MISAKAKKLLKSVRIIILIIFLMGSLLLIHPTISSGGLAIRGVSSNSSAMIAGIENPGPAVSPTSREVITEVNGLAIKDEQGYAAAIADIQINDTVTIITKKSSYVLVALPKTERVITNKTMIRNVTRFKQVNESINGTWQIINKTEVVGVTENVSYDKILGVAPLGLDVYPAPRTNIRKGLDLQGGTRVLLAPEREMDQDEYDLVLENLRQRLNAFGVSDVVVKPARDITGNQYVSVEIAGVNEQEIRRLLSEQGKFEAKIGEKIVFIGGNKDVTYVCRTPDCSGIDPQAGCGMLQSGDWSCRFRFVIALSAAAAQRQADFTGELAVVPGPNGDERYLEKPLDLYLDDALVSSLQIGESLRGRPSTDIAISGSGVGVSERDARSNARAEMKRLQTVLITGSLPVKLTIVKADTSSPLLGEEFLRSALWIALFAAIAVMLVIIARYRSLLLVVGIFVTMLAEAIILLGVGVFMKWNFDLAAVAGILISIGTGVNDQIVITDELLRGSKMDSSKESMKRAFYIVFGAFFTNIASLLPLLIAGAGLLKGFALTTIFGFAIGVLITRPAFAAMIEIMFD